MKADWRAFGKTRKSPRENAQITKKWLGFQVLAFSVFSGGSSCKCLRHRSLLAAVMLLAPAGGLALDRTNTVFKIFQFPADQIPRVDGKGDDWAIVPEDYVIGTDQLVDDTGKHPKPDPKTLDVRVRWGG
jgi:hypothetical protein